MENETFIKTYENAIPHVLCDMLIEKFDKYSEFMFPPKYGIEPFKMKKYEANGLDEFGWHVDVNTTDSMRRWLAFFCYLSDNDEGHTSFPYQKVSTDCKKGTIVMFPPMWPWLHQGAKPVDKPKYFLGSYLHYVD